LLDALPAVQPSRENVLQRVAAAGIPQRLAGVTWLDDAIGAVLAKLADLGVADSTVVIVASDNGKRGKFSCYDSGARMPMLIRWPGQVAPGSVCRELVSNIDFAPTIYDLAGIPVPGTASVDGTSIVPLLRGEGVYRRASLYLEISCTRAAVSEDFFKYIAVRFPPEIQERVDRGQRHTHWALPLAEAHHTYNNEKHYPGYFDADQLYNLAEDPREQRDLAGDPAHAERLAAMKALLARHVAPLPHAFGEFGRGAG
jgi:arylsulfatase A-like enzyme